ncbi:nitroreductase [Oikeobacillus pervagus]|uniref:Nitroreductase n=1 Tax=Oikeobacillus pervagus TaxID=1325931 RepID=A0AAJ1T699_9BACI|nr:nitroreductase family protein [Oikeobacillus pervagus]MDQ0215991.1 nitroreductase [Oikeobacillus pervagus]
MNVLEAIQSRREITQFLRKEISNDILEKVVEAAYYSPTGNNLPSREFIVVTNKQKLNELSKATPFVPWLENSAAAIVITGQPGISKYWLQDASIASGYIWLTAVSLGLGAAFGAIYHSEDQVESKKREDIVREALSIPEDRRIMAILGLGYPKEQPKPKKMLSKNDIVFYENFHS